MQKSEKISLRKIERIPVFEYFCLGIKSLLSGNICTFTHDCSLWCWNYIDNLWNRGDALFLYSFLPHSSDFFSTIKKSQFSIKKNSYLCAMKQKGVVIYLLLVFLLFGLWITNLMFGAVSIPIHEVIAILFGKGSEQVAWQNIIWQSRFPQAITALLAGASLATSGLLLQTLFKNPLAGPSILGISDGANLGVALIMFLLGSSFSLYSHQSIGGSLVIMIAAFVGAGCILGVIIFFSTKVTNNVMLLIIGIMIGYLASSMIAILNYYASADRVRTFVLWGMGDFSGVSNVRLPFFAVCTLAGLTIAVLLIKPLNALLLGEAYAANLGVKIKQTRIWILLCTGLLTATTTAFCGPISFIGLSVPHIARLLLGTTNHKLLLPVTILSGSCIALLCNILSVFPGTNIVLPLNAITPILGAPVIIYVIVNRKNIHYFM